MAHKKTKSPQIKYRPALPSDAKPASRLIFDTFPKMATFIFGLGDAQRAKKVFADMFSQEGHRFSYEFTQIVTEDDRLIGMFIAYPGDGLFSLNWQLARLLIKQYTFSEKLKLIQRGLPVIFIQEAAPDEYLLSNLAVKKELRGKGVGAQVLDHVENVAREAGYDKLSLMVDIDNQDARRFYERHGFVIKALHLESNQRVQHLGPGYQRMVKELR